MMLQECVLNSIHDLLLERLQQLLQSTFLHLSFYSAKETYSSAKETYYSAKETYYSAKETYYSAKETCCSSACSCCCKVRSFTSASIVQKETY